MPLPYREVYDQWQRSKAFGDPRDITQFSNDMNTVSGTNDFDSGANAGWWTKASTSADVNFFEPIARDTGLEAAGRAVGGLFGDPYAEAGARVAKSLPRTAAQIGAGIGAAFIPGVGEVASPLLLGSLFGAQTYAETGSPTAAGISGVTAAALPGVAKLGGKIGNAFLGPSKWASLAGSQAGLVGGLEASNYAQAKATGTPFDPLSPDFLAQQIPFSLFDIGRTALAKAPSAAPKVPTQQKATVPPYTPPAGSEEASVTRDALLERVQSGAKDMNLTPEQRSQMFQEALDAVNEQPSPVTGKEIPPRTGAVGAYQRARTPMEWSIQNEPYTVTGYAKPQADGNFKVLVTDSGGLNLPQHSNVWVNAGHGAQASLNEDGTVTFNAPYKAFSSNVQFPLTIKDFPEATEPTKKLTPQDQPAPNDISRDESAVLADVGIDPTEVVANKTDNLVAHQAYKDAVASGVPEQLDESLRPYAKNTPGGMADISRTNDNNELSQMVWTGEKPAAMLDIPPEESERQLQELNDLGVPFKVIHSDESGHNVVMIGKDQESLKAAVDAQAIPEGPEHDVAMGRALGYSDEDINNFVERMHGVSPLDPVLQLKVVAQKIEKAQVKKADAKAKIDKVPQNAADAVDLFSRPPSEVTPTQTDVFSTPTVEVVDRATQLIGKDALRERAEQFVGRVEKEYGEEPGTLDEETIKARAVELAARSLLQEHQREQLETSTKEGATPTQAFEKVRLQEQTPVVADSLQDIAELEEQARLINRLRRAEPAAGRASGIKDDTGNLMKFANEAEAVGFLGKYTDLQLEKRDRGEAYDNQDYEPREARGKFFLRVKSPTATVHIEGEPGHSLENVVTVEPQNRPPESFTEFQHQLDRAVKAPIIFSKTAGYDSAVDAVKDLYRTEVVLNEAAKGNTILKEINPVLKAQGMDEFETTDDMVSVVTKVREGLDEMAGDMGSLALGSEVPFDQDLHDEIGLGKPHGLANVLDWVKKNADPNGVIGDLAEALRKYSNFDHVRVTYEPTSWSHRAKDLETNYQIWKLNQAGYIVSKIEPKFNPQTFQPVIDKLGQNRVKVGNTKDLLGSQLPTFKFESPDLIRARDITGGNRNFKTPGGEIGLFYTQSKPVAEMYQKGYTGAQQRELVEHTLNPYAKGFLTAESTDTLLDKLGLMSKEQSRAMMDGETLDAFYPEADKRLAKFFRDHGIDYYTRDDGNMGADPEFVILTDNAIAKGQQVVGDSQGYRVTNPDGSTPVFSASDPLYRTVNELSTNTIPNQINIPYLVPNRENAMTWAGNVMHELAHAATTEAFDRNDPQAIQFRASLKDVLTSVRKDKTLPAELRMVIDKAVSENWYKQWVQGDIKNMYGEFTKNFKGDPLKWFSTFYGLLNEKELVAGIFNSPRFLAVLDGVKMRQTQTPVLKFFSSLWAKMFGASTKVESALARLISSTDDYLSNREFKGYNAMSYLRDYMIANTGMYPDGIAAHMDTLKNLYNTGDLEHSLKGFEREDEAGIQPATVVSGEIEPTLRQALSSGTPKEVTSAAMGLLADDVPVHQDVLNNLRGDLNAAQALYKNIKNGSVPGELSPNWEKNVQLNRAKVNALKNALEKQAKAIERWNALDAINVPEGIQNLWVKSLAGDGPPEPQDPTGVEDVARGALGLGPKHPEYIASERRRIAASGEKPLSWIDRMFKFTSFTSEEVPGFKPVYNTMLETQADAHRRMTELNTALISDPETQQQSKEIAAAYKRVATTEGLNKILSDMLRRAQVLEKMNKPVDLTDPEMQAALRRASDAKGRNGRSDRSDIISAFNSEGNRSQHRVDKVIPEHLSKMVEDLTTLSIIGREVGMPFPRAEQLSQQLHTALAQLKDPQTAPLAAESLRAVASGMKPETFLKVVEQANGFVADSEKTIQTMQRYRHYIGEQRYGKFQLVMSREGESYREGTNTEKAARARANELKADGWILEDIVPKNRANAAQVMGDDPIIRSMQELDQQALNRLESVITDLPPEQQAMLRPLVERAADYQASSAAFSPVPTQASPNRRFSAGRETIDMVANAAEETGRFINWMRHRESRVRTAAQSLDPELLANRPLREYANTFVNNQLSPDNPIARRLAEASFYWYLAGNFGVDFLHSIQSLTTGMASVIAESGGVGDALKYVGDASVKVAKRYGSGKWSNENDKWFVNWLTARGGLGLAAWADVFDPSTLNYFKAFGPDSDSGPLAALKKGIRGYKGLFLRHNDMVTGLAGFQLGLDRGMSLEDAARFAEGVKNRGLYSAGKVQRGVGFWSPKEKSIPQLLGALRTYTFGWFSQLSHNWKVGFAGAPGEYSDTQRAGAKNAFLYMLGTQAVLAGALGLPGVGQGLALLKQTTGIDLKGVARKNLGAMFGEDQDEYGGFLTGLALHGLVAQFAPFDPSGKHIPNIPFIGVTPYKGFDITSLIPAPFAQASDMIHGLATVAKGGDPSDILPYVLHGPIKLMHGGGDIRNSRGELIYPLSTSEKIVTALGLTPSRVAAAQETATTVDELNKAANQQKSKEVDEVAELTRRGDTNSAQKRLREIAQQNPTYDMRSFVRSVSAQVEKQTVPYNYRRDINPAIDIAGLGNDQPSRELERLQLRQGVQSQLGLYQPLSMHSLTQAASIDQLMNANPYMTRPLARQRLSVMRPNQYPLTFSGIGESQ